MQVQINCCSSKTSHELVSTFLSLSRMAPLRISEVLVGVVFLGTASAQFSNTSTIIASPTFPAIANVSTKVYNVSAATTTISYSYSNEKLAMLWNQVGSIAVGPITTTVEPTPEPTAYPRPGAFHAQVYLFPPYINYHC